MEALEGLPTILRTLEALRLRIPQPDKVEQEAREGVRLEPGDDVARAKESV